MCVCVGGGGGVFNCPWKSVASLEVYPTLLVLNHSVCADLVKFTVVLFCPLMDPRYSTSDYIIMYTLMHSIIIDMKRALNREPINESFSINI